MLHWLIRGLLIVAGVVTGWFVAGDAPNFGIVQVMVALMLITLAVAAVAFWPAGWKIRARPSDQTRP